jgi:signal transduction histidine kinase
MIDERYHSLLDLVRRVRHDANNPITAAMGHVQLLLEDPSIQNAEARESLRIVESELRRLTDIIRRLNDARDDAVVKQV